MVAGKFVYRIAGVVVDALIYLHYLNISDIGEQVIMGMVFQDYKWTWNYLHEIPNLKEHMKPNHQKKGNYGFWETTSNFLVSGTLTEAYFMCYAKA